MQMWTILHYLLYGLDDVVVQHYDIIVHLKNKGVFVEIRENAQNDGSISRTTHIHAY